jgi:hypothetical protein
VQKSVLRDIATFREGFSLVTLMVEGELRNVMMGLCRSFRKIHEYNHKAKEPVQLLELNFEVTRFAIEVYEGNNLIITGG